MCYQLVYIVFDFPDETTLKTPANIGRAIESLFAGQQASRFRLADKGFDSAEAAWNAAVKRGQRSVYLALSDEDNYEVTFSVVTNNWRRGYFAANRGQVTQRGPDALLEACLFFRTELAADYGFGLVALDTQALEAPGEGDYGLTTLYDFNYFSPRLIDKIGAGKLNSIPSQRTLHFPDGGLFVGMVANPLTDKKNTAASYQAASMILGLPKFQQGC